MDDIYRWRGIYDSDRIIERMGEIDDQLEEAGQKDGKVDRELTTRLLYEKMLQSIKLQCGSYGNFYRVIR